jgi:hypothetical protein
MAWLGRKGNFPGLAEINSPPARAALSLSITDHHPEGRASLGILYPTSAHDWAGAVVVAGIPLWLFFLLCADVVDCPAHTHTQCDGLSRLSDVMMIMMENGWCWL